MPQSWGAVAHSLVGFAFVWLGGYGKFEKLMKLLVGVMGFSILVCAALTMTRPRARRCRGLLMPTIPAGSGAYVLSLIGGIGGSITMLSYNYWMREEGMRGAGLAVLRPRRRRRGLRLHGALRHVDHADRQHRVLRAGRADHRRRRRCRGWPRCWARSSARSASRPTRLGFWAAVFASLLGRVAERAVPLRRCLRRAEGPAGRRGRAEITKVTSTPYRLGLLFITLVPLPFAFTGRPIAIMVDLHDDRQPVRAVPGGHAALPEQPRAPGPIGRAAERTGAPTCCWWPSWCSSPLVGAQEVMNALCDGSRRARPRPAKPDRPNAPPGW